MSEHALLAPSSAERWVNCPGSMQLCQKYPEPSEETDEQREGTAAHWAMAEVLAGQVVAEGQIAPNGWVLDGDMVEGAELFAETVRARVRGPIHVEERLPPGRRIHPHNWGTPDAWAYDGVLRVFDYKYGHGVVEVYENWQLVDYTALLLDLLRIDGAADQVLQVELTIVQPRVYHRDGQVRSWRMKASDLRGHINKLNMAAEIAFEPEPPVVTGEYCDHCSARIACPALLKAAGRIAQYGGVGIPHDLTIGQLGAHARMLEAQTKVLEARKTGVLAQIDLLIRQANSVPGWALESNPGREKWTVPGETVIQMGQLYGLDLAKPAAPITPNQARKAGMDESTLSSLSKREPTALKLVQDDGSKARRVFGKS